MRGTQQRMFLRCGISDERGNDQLHGPVWGCCSGQSWGSLDPGADGAAVGARCYPVKQHVRCGAAASVSRGGLPILGLMKRAVVAPQIFASEIHHMRQQLFGEMVFWGFCLPVLFGDLQLSFSRC